jgi:hypothetical protein
LPIIQATAAAKSHFSLHFRFDSFCTRLRNLLSMFKKINLYTRLFRERMEALLPEEALEDEFKTFDSAVRVLTLRDYDYLDFRNEAFDKDYVEFLTRMDSVTEKLQVKLEHTYDGVWDTPHAFQYLPRFEKLSEDIPVGGLAEKYMRMINTFSQEMDRIAKFFKKQVLRQWGKWWRDLNDVKANSRWVDRRRREASRIPPAGSPGPDHFCR